MPKKRELTRLGSDHAKLITSRVLTHLHLGAADEDGAFGQHDAPCEHTKLFQIVVAQGISLHIHRLVAVGLLGAGDTPEQGQRRSQKEGKK